MTDIQLTRTERLILANQYKILANIDNKFSDNYEAQLKIVEAGIEEMYSTLYTNISELPFDKNIAKETREILEMYRNLEPDLSNSKVPGADNLKFQGFDGNTDKHFIIMSILINDLGEYAEYKDFDYNSHSPYSLELYRKLLPKCKSLGVKFRQVTDEQIQELVEFIK